MVSKHFDLFYNHVQSIFASSNIFQECNLELYTDLENILHKNVITQLEDFLFDKYKVNWQNRMFSKVGNKLRTYKLFKEVFETVVFK
jgi:hypothetical protein